MPRRHLKPLTQWICDYCHELIEAPEHGWFEWVVQPENENGHYLASGFKIVHHALHSPGNRRGKTCFHYEDAEGRSDLHLQHFVGPDGLVRLLGILHRNDGGPPECAVANLNEFVEIARRLHVPHYEEARMYFAEAERDGYIERNNDIFSYSQQTLADIIRKYGPKPKPGTFEEDELSPTDID